MNGLVLSASGVSDYLRCHHKYPSCTIMGMKPRKRIAQSDLFWRHVDKSGECWVWTAALARKGYGRIGHRLGDGRSTSILVHRLSWEMANGPIPSGSLVSHTCKNRLCVNPAHLRLITNAQRASESRIPDTDAKFPWSRIKMPDGCWEWTGATSWGYGQFHREGSTETRAHRAAWEFAYGPIPEGLQVLHKCDNRKCCRPDHLFLGTAADNIHDMISKGRASWQRTSS